MPNSPASSPSTSSVGHHFSGDGARWSCAQAVTALMLRERAGAPLTDLQSSPVEVFVRLRRNAHVHEDAQRLLPHEFSGSAVGLVGLVEGAGECHEGAGDALPLAGERTAPVTRRLMTRWQRGSRAAAPQWAEATARRTITTFMYIYYVRYINDMSDPVVESMAEVRSHLADVIDRARREGTPTIITRRGKQEAVVIDIQEYQRLREIAENAEEAWLNQLADEAESEGTERSVSLEEMAALLRAHQG